MDESQSTNNQKPTEAKALTVKPLAITGENARGVAWGGRRRSVLWAAAMHMVLLAAGLALGVVTAAAWALAWSNYGPGAHSEFAAIGAPQRMMSSVSAEAMTAADPASALASAPRPAGIEARLTETVFTPRDYGGAVATAALDTPHDDETITLAASEAPAVEAEPTPAAQDEPNPPAARSDAQTPPTVTAAAVEAEDAAPAIDAAPVDETPEPVPSPTPNTPPSALEPTAETDTAPPPAAPEPAPQPAERVSITAPRVDAPASLTPAAAEPSADRLVVPAITASRIGPPARVEALLGDSLAPWALGSDSIVFDDVSDPTPLAKTALNVDPAFCASGAVAVFGHASASKQSGVETEALAVRRGLAAAARLMVLAARCPNAEAAERPVYVIARGPYRGDGRSAPAQRANMALGWRAEEADAGAVARGLREQLAARSNTADLVGGYGDCAVLRVDTRTARAAFPTAELEKAFCGQAPTGVA